jgi:hypothetical protein
MIMKTEVSKRNMGQIAGSENAKIKGKQERNDKNTEMIATSKRVFVISIELPACG